MHAPSRLVTGVLAAAVAVVTAGGASAGVSLESSAAPAVGVATLQLAGDVAAGIPTSTDLGAAAADQQINVTIGLKRPDAAGEAAYTKSLYDASSPNYHHYLSPDAFAARFGVSQAAYDTALTYATAHGMSLYYATPARDTLELTGTVQQAEDTFSVSLHNFHSSVRNDYLKTDYISNTAGPLVPANIGIIGVLGLSDERTAKVDTPSGTLKPKVTAVKPAQDTCTVACMGLTTPQDLWSIYDQPSTDMGQGSQMAIFGEGQSDDIVSDLRGFEKEMGLPAIPVDVVHTDGPKADYSDDAGAEEWNIDTQSSTGMSPLADREVLYFGSGLTDASVLGAFNAWANDPTGPKQASASYGECEEIPDGGTGAAAMVSAGAAYTVMSEQTLSAAVAGGKTLFSSSGDTGSGCPVLPTSTNGAAPQGVPQPNYPADSPNAVSVGGTVLYSTGSTPNVRSEEYSWNYTGGGTSFIFPEPDYQVPVGGVITGVCVGSPGGGTGNAGMPCRGVPDVAMQSGDIATNGYAITVKGANDNAGGGTSLASPMMMGTWTRIQAAAGDKAGFANEEFYKIGTDTTKDPDAFFDVGNPTNNQPGISMPNNSFGPYTNQIRTPGIDDSGWDYLSGFGVPDVAVLMKDIAGRTTPAPAAVAVTPPTTPVTPVTTPTPIYKPVPATVPVSCAVRSSSIKVSGAAKPALNKHGQALYTFKLSINKGRCKTPSSVGRQVYVYVDKHRVAVLRTGSGGLIKYLVRLTRGTHTVTASFVGNKDLKKSASNTFKARVV